MYNFCLISFIFAINLLNPNGVGLLDIALHGLILGLKIAFTKMPTLGILCPIAHSGPEWVSKKK